MSGVHEHLLYRAIHTQTNVNLFLKGEECRNKPKNDFLTILQEGKIFQTMQGGIGIPHMHWCGQEEDFNFIVMEELSETVEQLLNRCGGKFTMKTAYMLGIELIDILQYYHFKSFVNNNISVKHLMLGSGDNYDKLFIIDLSNSSKYQDVSTMEHIVEINDKKNDYRKSTWNLVVLISTKEGTLPEEMI